MARREYKGAATPTTLSASITNSATSLTLTDSTNWPTGSFSLVIDPGLAGEEKILATSRSGTTVTLTTRGYDNTSASAHTTGAVIYPVPTAIDFDEANSHVNASTGVHGLTGAVVGTTDTQSLTNKALSDSTTTIVDVSDATKAIKFDIAGTTSVTGTITTAFTTAKTVTIPDATDTLVGKATTDTLTNKTLTTPIITQGTSTPSFTTNAYTIVSSDAGLFLLASNSSTAGTISIPTDATWAAPNGTQIHIQQTGSGQLTIQAATSGTTTVVSNGATAAAPKIRAQYSVATLMKTSTNNWTVYGDIA
jgi:hypothetical protein